MIEKLNMYLPDRAKNTPLYLRVWKLPEEIGFFREEWKKLEKRYFFQFLPKESGKNWKKLEEIHEAK